MADTLYGCVTGSKLGYYSNDEFLINLDNVSTTGYDFMLENGALYEYVGSGSDWIWKKSVITIKLNKVIKSSSEKYLRSFSFFVIK